MGPLEMIILLIAGVPLALLIIVTALIVRALLGRQDRVSLTREEAEQLRRMWQAMDRMEERIANLETLLLQKENEHRTTVSGEGWKP